MNVGVGPGWCEARSSAVGSWADDNALNRTEMWADVGGGVAGGEPPGERWVVPGSRGNGD